MLRDWYRRNKSGLKPIIFQMLGLMCVVLFWFLLMNLGSIIDIVLKVLSLLKPFIYGFFIAYLINPLMSNIDKWIKLKVRNPVIQSKHKSLAMFFSYSIVIMLVLSFILLVIPQVVVSLNIFIQGLPNDIDKTTIWVSERYNQFIGSVIKDNSQLLMLKDSITRGLTSLLNSVTDTLPLLVSTTLSITNCIIDIILGFIISFYMLNKKETFIGQIKKTMAAYLKDSSTASILSLAQSMHEKLSNFLVATLIDACIVGVICYIFLTVFGINNALLIAFIIGVTNMVPYFGPYIGAIPSALLILLDNPAHMLIFICFIFILQQIDGNIIAPKLIGGSTGLSSFWVIFAVLIMTGLLGVVGMVLGVPIFAVIYMLLQNTIPKKLRSQGKSEKTEDYM